MAYDPFNRLTAADYRSTTLTAGSTGEHYEYAYDAVGNRTVMTSTTLLSGTVVATYTYDAAKRLTHRAVSDGRTYTYAWSQRGQLLAEWTQGYPVRTFTYNSAGQLIEATVFTQTTTFTYNGLGERVAVTVEGHETVTYTLDHAHHGAILAETTPTGMVQYLYGRHCLGEQRDAAWLFYLHDAEGLVRQGVDREGEVASTWLFDPDGTVLEGPEGPVSHLVCGGVYDWSTGLIYRGGRYFDPALGIWLALLPLMVVQRGRKRQSRRRWALLLGVALLAVGTLAGCGGKEGSPYTYCIDDFSMFFKHAEPVPQNGVWNTRYYYSIEYGWFDESHFRDHNVIDKVRNAVGNSGGEILLRDAQVGGVFLEIMYVVSGDVDPAQIEGVALGIFMDFQMEWEEWQGTHGAPAAFTYFSIDDLPSNMLKFIASYRNTTTDQLLTEIGAYQTNDRPPSPSEVGKTYFKPRQLNLTAAKYIERDWPAHWNIPHPIEKESGLWRRREILAHSPFIENMQESYP